MFPSRNGREWGGGSPWERVVEKEPRNSQEKHQTGKKPGSGSVVGGAITRFDMGGKHARDAIRVKSIGVVWLTFCRTATLTVIMGF